MGAPKFTGVLAIFFLGGCVTVAYTPTNPAPTPLHPKKPEQVEVFTSAVPARPHVEVGVLSTMAGTAFPETTLVEFFRKKAAAEGCDAIVFHGGSTSVSGNATAVNSTTTYNAACLAWGAPAASAQAQPASTPAPGPSSRCVPGESRACVGPGGCSGGQACTQDGLSFAPCDCGGTDRSGESSGSKTSP